jgi:TM2 domain-containing membrane protein YozV
MEKYGLPALVSLFLPGVGQLIKGHFLKGFLIWVFGGIIGFFLGWTIIIPFLFWVWNVYDAYNSPA